ncbi:MAG: signal peptidase I [Croceibacterium sp.]
MSETVPANAATPAGQLPAEVPAKKDEGSFAWFLVKLVIAVLVFRTLLFTSFMIPSESMMPRLLEGDYLFAAKWPYGFSRASLPLDLQLGGGGRLFSHLPARGDVVIFKHPVDRVDYVKRVIGLPGDRIEVVAGQVVLNGSPIDKRRTADFVLPIRPSEGCTRVEFTERESDGTFVCRYPRFHETLPGGVNYDVLDLGVTPQDSFAPITVPDGRVFVMGDNRDNSLDSRFPAVSGQGVGLVPVANLAGRASFMFFSTDGTASWLKPWTWFSAARWSRIGHSI